MGLDLSRHIYSYSEDSTQLLSIFTEAAVVAAAIIIDSNDKNK